MTDSKYPGGPPRRKAVLGYAQFRHAGSLLPRRFDDTIARRWGVELNVGSPVIVTALLIPSSMESGNKGDKPLLLNSGAMLPSPIVFQIWLSVNITSRSNPQCVHWTSARGFGEWSRSGCQTQIPDDLTPDSSGALVVNCTCTHLSAFAVLIDEVDIEASYIFLKATLILWLFYLKLFLL